MLRQQRKRPYRRLERSSSMAIVGTVVHGGGMGGSGSISRSDSDGVGRAGARTAFDAGLILSAARRGPSRSVIAGTFPAPAATARAATVATCVGRTTGREPQGFAYPPSGPPLPPSRASQYLRDYESSCDAAASACRVLSRPANPSLPAGPRASSAHLAAQPPSGSESELVLQYPPSTHCSVGAVAWRPAAPDSVSLLDVRLPITGGAVGAEAASAPSFSASAEPDRISAPPAPGAGWS